MKHATKDVLNPSWKTNGRQVVYDGTPWIRVEQRFVTTPQGVQLDDWYFADLPSFVNVLVRTIEGRFLILEVDKYACDGPSYSLVGGYLEYNETPLEAAKRELFEETGFESPTWIDIGSAVVDPNRGCGTAHFFVSDEAFRSHSASAPDREQIGELFLDRVELEAALMNGNFRAISWASCAMQGLLWLRHRRT